MKELETCGENKGTDWDSTKKYSAFGFSYSKTVNAIYFETAICRLSFA